MLLPHLSARNVIAESGGLAGLADLRVPMKSGDDVLMMPAAARVEVFTGRGRRRRWSTDLKAQIVEDSYSTSVSAAAYR